jgi:hypothetical protein
VDQLREVKRILAARVNSERPVGDFPPMAVRTMKGTLAPQLLKSWNVRQKVADACGEDDASGADFAAFEPENILCIRHPNVRRTLIANDYVVGTQLLTADAHELSRRRAISRKHVVRSLGRRVPSGSAGNEQDSARCTTQRERCAKPGRPAANDDGIEGLERGRQFSNSSKVVVGTVADRAKFTPLSSVRAAGGGCKDLIFS